MFETYDNKLETPAGTLSVIGNKGALTFDIDEIESGNKLKLDRMVVLHVSLDDMEKNVPFVLSVNERPLIGFEPTKQGIRYATTLPNGITFGIDVFYPAKSVSGFHVVGDVNDYRLELGSDNELSIVSQTDEPDTFAHIAVAWAQTEELAKAALFINPSA